MQAKEILAACFLFFGALLVWPLLTAAIKALKIDGRRFKSV